jgi:poly [ADP-ribose] polymerase
MKVAMSELGCDIDKLPIGKLTNDKIKRAHQILTEIQRLLVSEDEKEQKKHQLIVQLTNDFYNVIPHNFGMKKPPVIDHLLRVKEKTRMVE